ncbi:hypothetical protein H257_04241 [Aphanomyces astaci]|uniref:Uncharacterized protein n=1 Tax=Aphanomyces astaci TaxID=112090 RepID=W4GUW8_APHAT|nr:hypothetical protein H257_04241 [Aphanomyces astaci]ETV83530.1 hypothetical protein H257_04241 [Aphanomyces astaci]|eukprot:XP_009826960.1 hypothetical protein H257_04241 [Aphanomyces astaci]
MSDHEVQPPVEMVLDAATPKAKAGKSKEKKASSETKRSVRWCDESVATLFRLRYDSHLAKRFESKKNTEKKTAYVMLAAELGARKIGYLVPLESPSSNAVTRSFVLPPHLTHPVLSPLVLIVLVDTVDAVLSHESLDAFREGLQCVPPILGRVLANASATAEREIITAFEPVGPVPASKELMVVES